MGLTIEMGVTIIVYHVVCKEEFKLMPWNSRAPYYIGLENPTKSAKGSMRASKLDTWLAKMYYLRLTQSRAKL